MYKKREIGKAAYEIARKYETDQRIVVGVNGFVREDEQLEIPILRIDKQVELDQRQKLADLRARRDNKRTQQTLDELEKACREERNIMPPLLEAVRAYATLGEMVNAMKKVYGTYTETPVF